MNPEDITGDGDINDTSNAIEIVDCAPEEELILSNHSDGVDYIVGCNLNIYKAGIIIEPGTTIFFESDRVLRVDNNGYIEANGSTSEYITFSSSTKIAGAWGGIEIANKDVRNKLQACTIEYAGEANSKCALLVGNAFEARVSIDQCIVRHSSNFGIYVRSDSELLSFSNNTISNTSKASISVFKIAQLNSIESNNQFIESEEFDGVALRNSTTSSSENITINGIKVLFLKDTNIRGPLTISAGSELVMTSDIQVVLKGGGSNIGRIKANGTAANPIIIRGAEPINGFWAGILLEESSVNNSFSNVKLSDGGGRKISGTVTFQPGIANLVVGDGFFGEATKITMTNCEVNNSANCGVFVAKNSTYTPTNVTYNNNVGGNICNE